MFTILSSIGVSNDCKMQMKLLLTDFFWVLRSAWSSKGLQMRIQISHWRSNRRTRTPLRGVLPRPLTHTPYSLQFLIGERNGRRELFVLMVEAGKCSVGLGFLKYYESINGNRENICQI